MTSESEKGTKVTEENNKFTRGKSVRFKDISDKKLRGQLQQREHLYGKSAQTAAKFVQWLLPSEGGYLEPEGFEQTRNFQQDAIVSNVDLASSRKAYDCQLPDLGPYMIDYTSNGRYLLLGGRKGHLAMMDWKQYRLITELQVAETVRDVKFLHNELFFAAAQKKYTYIYDKNGVEIHCMKEHSSPLKLEFLPRHFLLASTDKFGNLRYQDTSTGVMIVQHRTKLGRCDVMRMNPYNAVIGVGHSNGTVTMWSPNVGTPLVSMLCHRGPLTALAFDSQGHYMVTTGADQRVKVWDARKLSPLHDYFARVPAKSLDISQKGLLAVGQGSCVEIWREALEMKQLKPYMMHRIPKGSQVQDLSFCPYEDVLGMGHKDGLSSILVPGCGEANFDTYVANPYETVKQRREGEIHALLDKLQPEMIVLEPNKIGSVNESKSHREMLSAQEKEANLAALAAAGKPLVWSRPKKGKKKHKRKQNNLITAKRARIEEKLKVKKQPAKKSTSSMKDSVPRALARFVST